MKKKMTNKQFNDYVDSKATKSNKVSNGIKAFIFGGLICIVGQLITDFFISRGFYEEQAGMLRSIVLIFLGAFLTGLNVSCCFKPRILKILLLLNIKFPVIINDRM